LWTCLADDNPKIVSYQSAVASTHLNLGILLLEINEPTKALDEQRQARAIFQKLADDNPKIPSYSNLLASGHTNVADALRILLRFDEAREGFEKAVAIRERLERFPFLCS
jgi:tetratricopeptide (TPR) repeat protein